MVVNTDEYKVVLSQIVYLLNYHDPTGMAHFFAALGLEDEFDIEAKEIIRRMPTCASPNEMVAMVNQVFEEYLNETTDFPIFVGENLMQLKQKYQWLQ